MISPVSVGVDSLAAEDGAGLGPGLPPQPVVLVAVHVPENKAVHFPAKIRLYMFLLTWLYMYLYLQTRLYMHLLYLQTRLSMYLYLQTRLYMYLLTRMYYMYLYLQTRLYIHLQTRLNMYHLQTKCMYLQT